MTPARSSARLRAGFLMVGLLAVTCGGSSSSSPSPTAGAACTPSALYGTQGERWTASGRLLDYAFAGYRTGTEAIPTPTGPAVSVTDFGARPDDEGDDTAAFLSALNAGSAVVTVPDGRRHVRPHDSLDSALNRRSRAGGLAARGGASAPRGVDAAAEPPLTGEM